MPVLNLNLGFCSPMALGLFLNPRLFVVEEVRITMLKRIEFRV